MLHWANKDQYYVKSSDYFTNYRFNLSEAVKKHEVKTKTDQQELDFVDSDLPEGLFVTFKIVDADEGDHGNIKTSDDDKRFFIISEINPIALIGENELEIYFEYRSDPEKGSKQERTWRDGRNKEAIDLIFTVLNQMPDAKHFLQGFEMLIPTEANKTRTLLEKYIYQYTSRNNRDFFIHKDLRSFLRRELDFYIKNEVMHLDDIEEASAPKAEEYLVKLKVIRKIAHKLIDFLAQLEDFQKKLWLKKKFVVETNYCITLDRVPKSLYPAICQNIAQREEWIRLFAIDEIEEDALKEGYSEPLSVKFLEDHDSLVLDTKFFNESFKEELLSSIDDFDDKCDGLLIHSENFQALGLLQERYREQIKCIYIDPPYNTAATEIIYKNSYKHSSWISLIHDRLVESYNLIDESGFNIITIDYAELFNLGKLIDNVFPPENQVGIITIYINPKGRQHERYFASSTEYMLYYAKNTSVGEFRMVTIDDEKSEQFTLQEGHRNYRLDPFARIRSSTIKELKPKFFYPIYVSQDLKTITLEPLPGYHEVYPVNNQGVEYTWKIIPSSFEERNKKGEFVAQFNEDGKLQIYNKFFEQQVFKNIWTDKKYFPEFYGTNLIKDIFGQSLFSYPKSVFAVTDALKVVLNEHDLALDYFSGSGTSGHAVINLNREDGGNRKYILVEMGDYFNTVLKPRIQKVIYSEAWKDGKPENRETGISHCFKYIRLESYEDTLNNLSLIKDKEQSNVIESNRALKEDYMLNYFLDVESRGSLLNVDAFVDPMNYSMKIKKAGSDEQVLQKIDLIETFNYLIGLRVIHIDKVQRLNAEFLRERDPELPHDQETKLILDGGIKESESGKWWIRKIEGWIPLNPYNPNDGQKEKVLIVWRNLTGNMEEDNLILDSWFERNRISPRDFEFDVIYVNGSNNLPNLRKEGEIWKVRLIEEEFLKAMWASKA